MNFKSLFVAAAIAIAAAACSQKNGSGPKTGDPTTTERPQKPTQGDRPIPPQPPAGNNDLPTDNPPPDFHKHSEVPKNVGKDCQDPAKASREECPRLYDPVCGCNGITYSNDCIARTEGVLKWVKGPCKR